MYSPKRRFKLFRDPAWTGGGGGGSISFTLADASALLFDNSTGYFDIASSTPFTIEWFQYLTGTPPAARPFSIGSYFSTNPIAVSMEGTDPDRTLYFWKNGSSPSISATFSSATPLLDTWVHFAVVGDGTSIQIYRDGNKFGSTTTYGTFTSTLSLAIGNQTSPNTIFGFNGYITNFRWVTGTAVYTDTFAVPTSPLTDIAGTKLLLLATDSASATTDSSSGARTATTAGTVVWAPDSPFA